jgi:multicomponent Na+:H+ antiporter subunit D
MQLHPFCLTLLSALLLVSVYGNNKLFKIAATTYPIFCAISLLKNHDILQTIDIMGLKLVIDYNFNNKLISFGFFIVTLAANLYALSAKKKLEIIFGTLYCAFAQLCLFSGDFISLFVGLESMLIFASLLLLMQNNQKGLKATKRYFITHLLSGSLVLIGISHVITSTGSINIIPLTPYFFTSDNIIAYSMMLTGCLINVAVFPFSGWMISCYPAASNSSFIYLISFTTKIGLIILIKLFPGLFLLKFFGIMLMITAISYALLEDNLKRILCYLSLGSFGLVLIGISVNSPYLFEYLFIDILYKASIALILIILNEKGISLSSEMHKISNYKFSGLVMTCVVICGFMIFNFPFLTALSYIKHEITENLSDNFVYLIASCNILMIFGILNLLIHSVSRSPKGQKLEINIYNKYGLCILASSTLSYNFIPLFKHHVSMSNPYMLEQLAVFCFAFVLACVIKPLARLNTKKLHLDLLKEIYDLFNYLYLNKASDALATNTMPFAELDTGGVSAVKSYNFIDKLKIMHNQKTGIFIVFSLLVIFIVNSVAI